MNINKLTAKELREQCPFGLIKSHPVSSSDTQSQFNRSPSSKGTKSKNFRGSSIYNVICQHTDCIESSAWETRRNFRNFRGRHWTVKHSKTESTLCKVVSFCDTEEKDGYTKLSTEYRLVDNALNYIDSNWQRPISLDVNSPVDEVKHESGDDFNDISARTVSSNTAQCPPIAVSTQNDQNHNRKRPEPPSDDDVHWYVHRNVSMFPYCTYFT